MRQTTAFKPTRELIYVGGVLQGPSGPVGLRLVLDTGSTHTLVRPHLVERAGYSLEDAESVTGVETAIGKEHGHLIHAQRFATLGVAAEDYDIHVFRLGALHDVDGLIGLTFLRRFNIQLRFDVGEIVVESL